MVLKMVEQIEMTDLKKETREQPATPSKYVGLAFYPYYLMKTLLKMAKESFTDFLPVVPPKSYTERQELIECILTRNSKQYQGKVYTEEQINELSEEVEVDKLFGTYKAKISGQMTKSLGKSTIKMYSMGACTVLGMTNQDAPSEDLESDPFVNSALQGFMCELYYRFGSFLAPLSIGIITSRCYRSDRNGTKNGGTNRDDRPEERDKRTANNPK